MPLDEQRIAAAILTQTVLQLIALRPKTEPQKAAEDVAPYYEAMLNRIVIVTALPDLYFDEDVREREGHCVIPAST